MSRWWDDSELVLLAHTGDMKLAEDFAAWCQQSTETLAAITGINIDDIDQRLARFVNEGKAVSHANGAKFFKLVGEGKL